MKKEKLPYQKKSINEPTRNETENPDDYKMGEEITPSPIIGKRLKTHNETCGCNDCFIESCHKIQNVTKDRLINTIRNFVQYKNKETTDLESHTEGCLCVNHLIHYKDKHIHFVDNLLEKIHNKNTETDNEMNVMKPDGKEDMYKQKSKSNYNKLNSKTSSYINHQNLTTLT